MIPLPTETGGAAKHVVARGALRPLVLLVGFPDRPHDAGHEPVDYSGILFADNWPAAPHTVRDYHGEVSYGALRILGTTASVQGWRRLDTPLATHVGDDQGNSLGGRLVADAVAAAPWALLAAAGALLLGERRRRR